MKINKGFDTPPTYTLKLKTEKGNYIIPYTVDRLSTQHKTDIRACAISRLIFGVLQYPESDRNRELLAEALSSESVQQIHEIAIELVGTDFTGTTYPADAGRIQFASTKFVAGYRLEAQDLEKDVKLAS